MKKKSFKDQNLCIITNKLNKLKREKRTNHRRYNFFFIFQENLRKGRGITLKNITVTFVQNNNNKTAK